MTPAWYAILVLLVASVFFVGVPGSGAFVVRSRWRSFRGRIADASLLPTVEYSKLAEPGEQAGGRYRFLGRLEAMQGEDRIWVTNGRFSVAADLSNVTVYLLPSPYESSDLEAEAFVSHARRGSDEAPRGVRWKRIFSLPQGIQMLLAGPFTTERGRGVFRSLERDRLLAVIFDGDPSTLLPRATWGGRQRNEYWNQYTLASLLAGSFTLLVLAFLLLGDPYSRVPALLALTAAAFPLSPVLPPGILLYLPYRQLWNRARLFRAERDLVRLPMRHFAELTGESESTLPDGEPYALRKGTAVRCLQEPLSRKPSYLEGGGAKADPREVHTFGALGHDELGEYLTRPEDAMAELVRIPGNPTELARVCAAKARLLEWLSGVMIIADIGINLFLVLLILSRVLAL